MIVDRAGREPQDGGSLLRHWQTESRRRVATGGSLTITGALTAGIVDEMACWRPAREGDV